MNKLAGTDMLSVAYKSQGQQFTDVLEGRIHVVITSPPVIDPHKRAGKLRVLAVDGSKGFQLWPEVSDREYQATLLQMGFTVEDVGTPDSIRQLLAERREYWQKVFAGLNVRPE